MLELPDYIKEFFEDVLGYTNIHIETSAGYGYGADYILVHSKNDILQYPSIYQKFDDRFLINNASCQMFDDRSNVLGENGDIGITYIHFHYIFNSVEEQLKLNWNKHKFISLNNYKETYSLPNDKLDLEIMKAMRND